MKILILCIFLFSLGFYIGVSFASKKFQSELKRVLNFNLSTATRDK